MSKFLNNMTGTPTFKVILWLGRLEEFIEYQVQRTKSLKNIFSSKCHSRNKDKSGFYVGKNYASLSSRNLLW